jgi:hypothetical protein
MTRIGNKKTYFLIKPELDRSGIKCGWDKLTIFSEVKGCLLKRKITKREQLTHITGSTNIPTSLRTLTLIVLNKYGPVT